MNEKELKKFINKTKRENKFQRMLAYVLNGLIYGIITLPIYVIIIILVTFIFIIFGWESMFLYCTVLLSLTLLIMLGIFYVIPELGKTVMGLEVVGFDGEKVSPKKELLNSGYVHVIILSFTIFLALFAWIYFIALVINKDFWRRSTIVVTEEQLKELKILQNKTIEK